MTRLAVGPAGNFLGGQQTAVRTPLRFIVADYASQIDDYSGRASLSIRRQVRIAWWRRIVKTRLLQPGGRTVNINYLVRGGRVIDVYLNGTISDLATRRDEFASIIASGGADGLIKRLQDRTESLIEQVTFAMLAGSSGRCGARGRTTRCRAGADRRRCKLALVVQWGTSDQFHHRIWRGVILRHQTAPVTVLLGRHGGATNPDH